MPSKKIIIEKIFRDYVKREMTPKERKVLFGESKKKKGVKKTKKA